MVLKNHIAIFSITNTKKYAVMVEGKPKNMIVELQCIAIVAKMVKEKTIFY